MFELGNSIHNSKMTTNMLHYISKHLQRWNADYHSQIQMAEKECQPMVNCNNIKSLFSIIIVLFFPQWGVLSINCIITDLIQF